MQSGIKTSEFYLTVGTLTAGLLVMAGVLKPENQAEVTELITQVVGGIVALGSLITYIFSRTELKSKMTQGTPKA